MMHICISSSILGINKDVLGMVRMGWVEEEGEGGRYEPSFYSLRSLRAVYERDISIVGLERY